MDQEEQGPKMSPLSRIVRFERQNLEIAISEDGEGTWRLEVINEQGTRTTWMESFKTEKRALNEALKAIRENGVDDFTMDQPYKRAFH